MAGDVVALSRIARLLVYFSRVPGSYLCEPFALDISLSDPVDLCNSTLRDIILYDSFFKKF